MIILMSMSKRFQIPSDDQDQRLYREAAKKQGVPAAEWARRILREQARKELSETTFGDLMKHLESFGEFPDLELPKREPPRKLEGLD